ncbi:MAG: phosphoglycerate kinase [Marinilabiliales bacterium]|nr:MAG: phosphoglycerate kinase [Marinilabiliales bacterium]
MTTIETFDFKKKKALIRVDFNVPLNSNFEITDDNRIRAAIPTIKKILASGGSVILMSHLGRPKTGYEEKFSLKHLVKHISKLSGANVKFAGDCIGNEPHELAENLKPGEILLLENLRFHKEEEKGNEEFAAELASLADVYVNDAFGTAHRAHASTAIVAKFFPENKMFGYLIENELKSMDKVLKDSQKPFTAIMGGAKVSDKILIIENLLDRVDNLVIGGGMVYTFIKARGGSIGSSIVEEDRLDMALELFEKAKKKNVNLVLPVDNVVADKFDAEASVRKTAVDSVPDGWMGLDIGEESINMISDIIRDSKTILWNGPMGVFEMEKFEAGTRSVALAIAEATSRGAFSLIGGGDSVAAINKYDLGDKVSYVSTGGGAMLEYMEGKELPGIKAISG